MLVRKKLGSPLVLKRHMVQLTTPRVHVMWLSSSLVHVVGVTAPWVHVVGVTAPRVHMVGLTSPRVHMVGLTCPWVHVVGMTALLLVMLLLLSNSYPCLLSQSLYRKVVCQPVILSPPLP